MKTSLFSHVEVNSTAAVYQHTVSNYSVACTAALLSFALMSNSQMLL